MDKILVKDVVACLLKMPQDMEVLEPFEDIGLFSKRNLPRVELQKEEMFLGEMRFVSCWSGDDKSTFKKYCII